ncbi:sugar transferase [Streptomyces sp. NPDC051018]|uniref:sugar transferase n=1 Tax=Streptomyces sp. NPDC051018 TaxID=3365639 RepID=UPI0037A3954D
MNGEAAAGRERTPDPTDRGHVPNRTATEDPGHAPDRGPAPDPTAPAAPRSAPDDTAPATPDSAPDPAPPTAWGPVPPSAKRAVDLLASTALLLLLAVPLLALAAAVAATSRGPVLLRRERAGLNGRPFPMLTFRMTPATRVGKLLHRHYLDHLPQLLNVVRGEMSLVGPRPLTPERTAALTGADRVRTAVRPGITGLWQIGGRTGLPWEEMAVLDAHYVREHWLGMDLAILARTLPATTRGRGPRRACGLRQA